MADGACSPERKGVSCKYSRCKGNEVAVRMQVTESLFENVEAEAEVFIQRDCSLECDFSDGVTRQSEEAQPHLLSCTKAPVDLWLDRELW